MMAMIGLAVFAAAFSAIVAVFWLTLIPALPRIAELLAGDIAPAQALSPVRRLAVIARPIRLAPAQTAWRAAA